LLVGRKEFLSGRGQRNERFGLVGPRFFVTFQSYVIYRMQFLGPVSARFDQAEEHVAFHKVHYVMELR
jgi:hypothetical protein